MRYAQGGGPTAERRAFREQVRLEAAGRFARGEKTAVIAKELRVSERPAERSRRTWRAGGIEGLRSAGPAKAPKLSAQQFTVLEEELGRGPAAHGWEDQRWTLAGVQTVIDRRFRISLSVAGVWRLLQRHGWSWQSPARRALQRDEGRRGAVEEGGLAPVEAPWRRSGPGSPLRTKPGSR